jgi:hypothetical protein
MDKVVPPDPKKLNKKHLHHARSIHYYVCGTSEDDPKVGGRRGWLRLGEELASPSSDLRIILLPAGEGEAV